MGISCTWAGQFLNTRGARRPGLRIVVTQRRECPASSGARGSLSCILKQMWPPNMQAPIGASLAIHAKAEASPQARKYELPFSCHSRAGVNPGMRELATAQLNCLRARPVNNKNLFSVSEVVAGSEGSNYKSFKQSHVSKMLRELGESGLVYKNRWGKYSLAVPLMSQFIQRQYLEAGFIH